MLLIILACVCLLVGIVLVSNKSHNLKWRNNGIGIIIVSLIVTGGCGICTYYRQLNGKAYLESFYNTNVVSYQIAVDKTTSYLSQDKFADYILYGDIEKQQLATSISDRIAEWRDSVVVYNQVLKAYQLYQDNFVTGIFYPKLDKELKYLEIK